MTFGSTYVSPAKSYLIFRVNNMAKKEFYKIELPNGKVVELKNGVNRQGNRGVEVYRDGKKVCFVEFIYAADVYSDLGWYDKFVEDYTKVMHGHI